MVYSSADAHKYVLTSDGANASRMTNQAVLIDLGKHDARHQVLVARLRFFKRLVVEATP